MSKRPTLAPRTSEPVSSSSPGPATDVVLLKTPTAQLAVNGGSQHPDKRRAGGHGPTLADEIEWLLPTPTAHDGKGSGPSQLKRNSLTLQEIAHLLPTPTVSDSKASGGSTPSDVTLTDAVVRTDFGKVENPRHLSLLPTPEASDASGGRVSSELGGTRPSGVKRSITLATAVHHEITAKAALLPTPSVADATGGHASRSGARSNELLLPGLAKTFNGSDRFGKYAAAIEQWERITNTKAPDPTEPTGRGGQHRLSPAFAAWMMGLHKFHITDEGNGLSRKAQLKLIGNAVVPHQASHAVSGLLARAVAE